MKVYVVKGNSEFGDCFETFTLGVFSTREKAIEEINKSKESKLYCDNYNSYDIIVYQIDNPNFECEEENEYDV